MFFDFSVIILTTSYDLAKATQMAFLLFKMIHLKLNKKNNFIYISRNITIKLYPIKQIDTGVVPSDTLTSRDVKLDKKQTIETSEVKLVLDSRNQLGECPLWDSRTGQLWWTDILNSSLYCFDLKSKRQDRWRLSERLGSFAFTDDPNKLLLAFESGLAFFDLKNSKTQWLQKLETELLENRLNDGRCDRQGRFWIGSMNENESARKLTGSLYRFRSELNTTSTSTSTSKMATDIAISNSIVFSPDDKYLYFADSFQQTIWRYNFESETGEINQRVEFAKTETNAFPDGSAVDSHGNLWNAQWGASQIVCYSSDGKLLLKKRLPISQPSCVTFGGLDLQTVFITSARVGLAPTALESQPYAGSIFSFRSSVKGLKENLFKINS